MRFGDIAPQGLRGPFPEKGPRLSCVSVRWPACRGTAPRRHFPRALLRRTEQKQPVSSIIGEQCRIWDRPVNLIEARQRGRDRKWAIGDDTGRLQQKKNTQRASGRGSAPALGKGMVERRKLCFRAAKEHCHLSGRPGALVNRGSKARALRPVSMLPFGDDLGGGQWGRSGLLRAAFPGGRRHVLASVGRQIRAEEVDQAMHSAEILDALATQL